MEKVEESQDSFRGPESLRSRQLNELQKSGDTENICIKGFPDHIAGAGITKESRANAFTLSHLSISCWSVSVSPAFTSGSADPQGSW